MTVEHIVLIGLKHAGKSTVGQRLASELNLPFFDSDQLMLNQYAKINGEHLSYPELYQSVGEVEFRQLEQYVILSCLNRKQKCLLATGGSSPLNKEIAAQLKLHHVIYLSVDYDCLLERWRAFPPQFLKTKNLEQEFELYYQHRHYIYKKLADEQINIV